MSRIGDLETQKMLKITEVDDIQYMIDDLEEHNDGSEQYLKRIEQLKSKLVERTIEFHEIVINIHEWHLNQESNFSPRPKFSQDTITLSKNTIRKIKLHGLSNE